MPAQSPGTGTGAPHAYPVGPLRSLFEPQHEDFRRSVAQFVARSVVPHAERWDEERVIDRATWLQAGAQGLLGLAVPEDLGGGGTSDYRFRVVVQEELSKVGAAALVSSLGPAGRHRHPVRA